MMNKNGDEQKFNNLKNVGNYTKQAVKKFENNIVNEKDYLDKVKDDETSKEPNKFH